MSHTRAWDETQPAGSSAMSTVDNVIRDRLVDIRERMAADHVWGASADHDGKHKKVVLRPDNDVTPITVEAPNEVTGSGTSGLIDLEQTWNTTGAPVAVKVGITKTAVDAAAKLLQLAIDGTVKFEIDLDGNISVGGGDPAGTVKAFAGAVAPSGYLLCDGAAVSRTTYARLFAVIGTVFGSGDGSTTFNVPDGRGRALIGAGTGTGLTPRALGAKVGTETHVLSASEIPAHSHPIAAPTEGHAGAAILETLDEGSGPDLLSWPSAHTDGVTKNNTGGGGAHANMQPSLALNFIIKT
jgi:microcystin-dependent protein